MQIQTGSFGHGFTVCFSRGYPTYDDFGTRAIIFNDRFFKWMIINKKVDILIPVSIKIVPKGLFDHKSTLVQVMASTWHATNHYLKQLWPSQYGDHNEHDGVSNHQRFDCLLSLINKCSGPDQRKHQSSASLAFVREIHRWPVNSPHKGPVAQKMFPFDDVIMSPVPYGAISPRGVSALLAYITSTRDHMNK